MTLPSGKCAAESWCEPNTAFLKVVGESCVCKDDTYIWTSDSSSEGGSCVKKPPCSAGEGDNYIVKTDSCLCPSPLVHITEVLGTGSDDGCL